MKAFQKAIEPFDPLDLATQAVCCYLWENDFERIESYGDRMIVSNDRCTGYLSQIIDEALKKTIFPIYEDLEFSDVEIQEIRTRVIQEHNALMASIEQKNALQDWTPSGVTPVQ